MRTDASKAVLTLVYLASGAMLIHKPQPGSHLIKEQMYERALEKKAKLITKHGETVDMFVESLISPYPLD